MFPDRFSKNIQVSNFVKIGAVGDDLFHTDRRTDRQTNIARLIVALRNRANAPKRD